MKKGYYSRNLFFNIMIIWKNISTVSV